MSMTRKQFCEGMGCGTVLLLLGSCGGGGDSSYNAMPTPNIPSGTGCSATAITANHGHSLMIAKTDLDSTSDKTYSILGTATHDHQITLTVAQLAQLKAGATVMVTSTQAGAPAHTHEVSVGCM
jgi:hypothetical protein